MIAEKAGVAVEKGPKDLREIPQHFGRAAAKQDYGAWDIEIVAEINNAPRMPREAVRAAAEYFRASGADVIDIGCTPGVAFPSVGAVVRDRVRRELALEPGAGAAEAGRLVDHVDDAADGGGRRFLHGRSLRQKISGRNKNRRNIGVPNF